MLLSYLVHFEGKFLHQRKRLHGVGCPIVDRESRREVDQEPHIAAIRQDRLCFGPRLYEPQHA